MCPESSSHVIVISSLNTLMLDQVTKLESRGSLVEVSKDLNQFIVDSNSKVIFAHLEVLVAASFKTLAKKENLSSV